MLDWNQAQVRLYLPAETHHHVSNEQDRPEESQTHSLTRDLHAVPESLDPLSKKGPGDDEEGVEIIVHVPARKLAVYWDAAHAVFVVLLEQLCADHGEEEDHDEQEENLVP